MTKSKAERPAIPMVKMALLIFAVILGSTILISYLADSALLYNYANVQTQGKVVNRQVADQPDNLFVTIDYMICNGVTESVNLGKKVLDKKAPQALLDIRSCLSKIPVSSSVLVKIRTRVQRLTRTKSGRITQIGPCEVPLLPSVLDFKNNARCPWM